MVTRQDGDHGTFFSSWMFRLVLPDVPTDVVVLAVLGTAVKQTNLIILIVVLDGLN